MLKEFRAFIMRGNVMDLAVAVIIGGVDSYIGLILGAFLLSSVQQLSAFYIDSKWMDTFTYILLIAFLIWKPLGFSGKQLKKVEI